METLSVDDKNINLDLIIKKNELLKIIKSGRAILKKNIEIIILNNQEILMRQGDRPVYFYLVYSGSLVAYKNGENWQDNIVGFIHSGEMIGELSLVTNAFRSANIMALRQTILLQIPNKIMKKFMTEKAEVMYKITSVISKRLTNIIYRNPNKALEKKFSMMALIPAGSSRITKIFLNKFLPVLSKYKSTFILNENTFHELMPNGNFNIDQNSAILLRSQVLTKLEKNYSLIILDCGYHLNEWSRFCLHNADTFLYIADEESAVELNPIEAYIRDHKNQLTIIHKRLVCVYSSLIIIPKMTHKWTNGRDITSFHNLCYQKSGSLESLARIITRCCIGLVLSGGGLLGLAHIGVIRALEEANIEVDVVGGVSSGAIIAALYASGLDSNLMINKIKNSAKKINRMKFYLWQFPISSLMSPMFGEKMIRLLCGDFYIEDLWKSFFCVACNLSTTQDKVFEYGPLKNAVLASNALPGLLSPMVMDGELFVDGGVANTMPADVMKNLYGGFIVGVNVSQKRTIEIDKSRENFPTSREIILNRLNPFKDYSIKMPLLHEIVTRSFVIGNKRKLAEVEKFVDYLIEPDFTSVTRVKLRYIDELINIGYNSAKEIIQTLKVQSNHIQT